MRASKGKVKDNVLRHVMPHSTRRSMTGHMKMRSGVARADVGSSQQ